MKYNPKYCVVALAVVLAISWGLVGLVSAGQTTKVIGECEITAGSSWLAFILLPDGRMGQVEVEAYEDQIVYILAKDDAAKSYMGQMDGFIHNCPTHGREVLELIKGAILIPYDDANAKCKLFETD